MTVDFPNASDAHSSQQTNTTLRLTNIGTTAASYDYALSVLSRPCTSLLTYTSTIDVGASEDLLFRADVGTAANVAMCARFDYINTFIRFAVSFVEIFEIDRQQRQSQGPRANITRSRR